jgi:hypothetical protein
MAAICRKRQLGLDDYCCLKFSCLLALDLALHPVIVYSALSSPRLGNQVPNTRKDSEQSLSDVHVLAASHSLHSAKSCRNSSTTHTAQRKIHTINKLLLVASPALQAAQTRILIETGLGTAFAERRRRQAHRPFRCPPWGEAVCLSPSESLLTRFCCCCFKRWSMARYCRIVATVTWRAKLGIH